MPATVETSYSGWWRRVGASLIDSIAVIAISLGIGIVIAIALGPVAGLAIGFFGLLVVSPAYFTYFHGKTGRTWGKAAFGIYVADVATSNPIGYGRAFGRWCAQVLLFGFLGGLLIVLPYLNVLWPLWDDHHQALHDKMVSSSVFRDC